MASAAAPNVKSAFKSIDTAGEGSIDRADVGRLLQLLNPGHTITQNDVLFALKEVEITDDGRVKYTEFKKWFDRLRKGHRGSQYNKLLVKDLVGKSRTSSYDLPSKQFTFGKVIPRDVNDAKEVISNWQSGKQRVSGSEILRARNTRGAPSRVKIYGHINRPSTPMGKLIQGEFAGTVPKDKEYPDRPTHPKVLRKQEQALKERKAVDEAAARGRLVRAGSAVATGRDHMGGGGGGGSTWKMKKFTHVKAKLNTHY